MAVVSMEIDGKPVASQEGESILLAARAAGIDIPTLCHMEGLSEAGSCRLCLVEVNGAETLVPACKVAVAEGQQIRTNTERLREHRRQIIELLFAGGNHVCAACVANGHCELQDAAIVVGMDHVRYDYAHRDLTVDLSHERFGIDHNRCILCTRCIRACGELEGAHTWGLTGRGAESRVVTDLDQPWGESTTCTSCGKCVMACPTGALFHQGDTVTSLDHHRERLTALVNTRRHQSWAD